MCFHKCVWQICELEEYTGSFFEYTVSAVPEIWIQQMEDGSFVCYWPQKNAGKKIRSFTSPNDGGIWKIYKCRILMNGEKFSRYDRARQAEKIAQDVSCLSESTKMLNSTMDFDVADIDVEGDHGKIASAFVPDCNSTMDFDVSEESHENIVGNDSAKFNKEALISSRYYSNGAEMMVNGDFPQSYYPSSDDMCNLTANGYSKPTGKLSGNYGSSSCSSMESSYSNRFGRNTDFLTSTATDETNFPQHNDNGAILSSIKELEINLSSFYQVMQEKLHEIKGFLSNKSVNYEVQPNHESMLNSTDVHDINQNFVGDVYRDEENNPTEEDQANHITTFIWTNAKNQEEKVDEIILVHDNSSHENDQLMANDHILLDENIGKLLSPPTICTDRETLHVPEPPIDKTFDIILPKELKMKVANGDQFSLNEDLLELDEEVEKSLVKKLLPLPNEQEGAYMNRIVNLLFEKNFFLDFITWKPEKQRTCIKHSNTLKCWKESYGPRFGSDEKNAKFMAHFRRIKSAKRAAINAAKKRALIDLAGKEPV